jgi:hypothetical protein
MDITEYWATLVSIIIGLGLADLLVNLHRLIHDRKRVRWDSLPLLWAGITLLLLFNHWWAIAMNLDGSHDARFVGEFVLLASSSILLFLMCASVLPRAVPVEGQLDMRGEWAESRRVFLVLFWIRQIDTGVIAALANGGLLWDQAAVARTILFGLITIALFTTSRRVEWGVAFAVLSVLVWRISLQSVH